MKRFNYTGVCIPDKHYMVDVSNKLNEIIEMIDYGDYFTISRPRQYGKSTNLMLLTEKLKERYLPIKISFQGNDENSFKDAEEFAKLFINSINIQLKLLKSKYLIENKNITSLLELSQIITKFIERVDKKVVLFIDEVDQASNYKLFSKFLGMLRDKYLKSNEGEDKTFHSVILAGVHDIKNLKMKIRGEKEIQYNSPWNIAVDFKVNMSFLPDEISTMLKDYEDDHNTGMDIDYMSKKLYDYTTGYPYLVSKLCYIMDRELKKDFTEEGLENAIKILLNEDNTLFDDLIKNINRYKELYNLVKRVVLEGEEINYNVDAHQLGIMYGIFRKSSDQKLKIHNKIFEIRLYNYMIAMREIEKGSALSYKYRENFVDENGDLKMELVLEKFQELIAEYRKIDEEFVEREGRLLFLAFLKPIINGTGFYFVESETRHSNRMDIVVTYNRKKYVIELKIWRGGKYEQEGREQLAGYLKAQNLEKGYMIFYNFNKSKEYLKERLDVNDKEIFEIVV